MGQYYHQITETLDENGNLVTKIYNTQTISKSEMKSYDDYNGLKLMEHSWWRNDFCTRLASTLLNKPTRLAWVGDYSEEEDWKERGYEPKEAWVDENDYSYPPKVNFDMDSVKYLVNVDKKEFVDLKKYKEKCDRNGWCIFPISLLTALGNGRGGGDYHDCHPCYESVGAWAWDRIFITNDNIPNDYIELEVIFNED